MGRARSASAQRRVFLVAAPTALLVLLAAAVLLGDGVPLATRHSVSSGGLVLAGLAAIAACSWRAGQTRGRRRRSWRLLALAAAVAVVANAFGAMVGYDPVESPSLVADLGLLVAMLLSIWALATFPIVRRRGADQAMLVLDGLVVGGGILALASVLVYPELLASAATDVVERVTLVAFPVLDLVLATVAVLLLLRAGGRDRPSLVLIAAGFITYALTDLAYAVLVARDDFDFGGHLDLGWVAGYLMLSLAALYPNHTEDEPEPRPTSGASTTRGAVLIFSVILAAGIVQVWFGEKLQGSTARLWLVIVVAAGLRQALLSADNASLRRGLERRVREQTADLHRLARENQALLESVGDGIYGVDTGGRITFANPSAAESLGVAADQLLGHDAHLLFHGDHEGDHGNHDGDADCYISRAIRTGSVVSGVEDSYAHATAGRLPVEITASPVLDADDVGPRGAVVVFRDVTQRHEVDRMKNEFLSVVSHELRTPLTSIRGSLGLLAGGAVGDLDPRAASMVSVAVESSERLTRLINDLLDIERIDSGARPMRVGVIDAAALVGDAVHQIQGMATPLGVVVEAGDCSGHVLGDEDQVMQTLTNLLGNAIKFSEPGGVVVACTVELDGHVVFRVQDHGRGIPADALEHVFEPFAQVDSSDARQKGGTGLGLAISRSIVARHGGRIWAESLYGQGTLVQFTLPAAP